MIRSLRLTPLLDSTPYYKIWGNDMGNTFGKLFKVHTFGESHGQAIGVVIDGCPAGHSISLEKIQEQLNRRRPGQSEITSLRQEKDLIECLSGLENNRTLGTPITLIVKNADAKPEDYSELEDVYRPSHADYTTKMKYGIHSKSGGGRASARETIGRVAAAALAEQILSKLLPELKITALVESIMELRATEYDPKSLDRATIDQNPVRCPDVKIAQKMEDLIKAAAKRGDSLGGVVFGIIQGCPVGLGEPVFDKLEADLAKAMMSIPATKGFEIGLGFASTLLLGSQHNDAFTLEGDQISTITNHSGGVQGGISNGQDIYFRIAFKPVSTIKVKQRTVNKEHEEVEYTPSKGRHDPCVVPRAVPIVEAMATLVITDHFLRNTKSQHHDFAD